MKIQPLLTALALSISGGWAAAASTDAGKPGAATVEESIDYEEVAVNSGYASLQAACESGGGRGSSICTAHRVQKARAEMKVAYQSALESLDPPENEHEDDQRALLAAAQQAWEGYVSRHCYFYATHQMAGNWNTWSEFWRHDCELPEIRHRAKFLQDLAKGDMKWIGDECPTGEPRPEEGS